MALVIEHFAGAFKREMEIICHCWWFFWPYKHEIFLQLKRDVYSLFGGLHFRKGKHKEKAEDDSASTATGMRNREVSKESHEKTLAVWVLENCWRRWREGLVQKIKNDVEKIQKLGFEDAVSVTGKRKDSVGHQGRKQRAQNHDTMKK